MRYPLKFESKNRWTTRHVMWNTLTRWYYDIPSHDFLNDCLDVWKVGSISKRSHSIRTYDGIDLRLGFSLNVGV